MSPWSDKKVSERAGHNSVALPTAEGRREGDRICPALTETFKSLQGDIHSTAVPLRSAGNDFRLGQRPRGQNARSNNDVLNKYST